MAVIEKATGREIGLKLGSKLSKEVAGTAWVMSGMVYSTRVS